MSNCISYRLNKYTKEHQNTISLYMHSLKFDIYFFVFMFPFLCVHAKVETFCLDLVVDHVLLTDVSDRRTDHQIPIIQINHPMQDDKQLSAINPDINPSPALRTPSPVPPSSSQKSPNQDLCHQMKNTSLQLVS